MLIRSPWDTDHTKLGAYHKKLDLETIHAESWCHLTKQWIISVKSGQKKIKTVKSPSFSANEQDKLSDWKTELFWMTV